MIVTVVDYGVGNLRSVCMALESCGASIILASTPNKVKNADRLILPGVGAFAHAMQKLQKDYLDHAIAQFVEKERPLLGICLGMQMLFDSSEEFGIHDGLGLIPGVVKQICPVHTETMKYKIPHISWAELLEPENGSGWAGTVLSDTLPRTPMYFVHSFAGVPLFAEHRLADCLYGEHTLCASVGKGSIYGVQFHPEKSGPSGLKLLNTFLAI